MKFVDVFEMAYKNTKRKKKKNIAKESMRKS